jgi:peptidoglycan/xylan/chitin deacetylase (PgdA/CDA1 family)
VIAPKSSGPLLNRSRRLACFAYHSIHADGPPVLSLAPDSFEDHLRRLRRRGFRSARLSDLEALADGGRPAGRMVSLTFDDGYLDNYTTALPLLREYGFSALFFVLPTFVDEGGPLDWKGVEKAHASHPDVMRSMTWPMVEEMVEAGMEFGSHTISHPRLPTLGDEELAQELLDSRRRMIDRLGQCDSLAYPFGNWDARVERAAAAAGYRFAFTLPFVSQRAGSPLSIPRIAMDHRDDGRRFALKLSAPVRWAMLGSPLKPTARQLQALARGG